VHLFQVRIHNDQIRLFPLGSPVQLAAARELAHACAAAPQPGSQLLAVVFVAVGEVDEDHMVRSTRQPPGRVFPRLPFGAELRRRLEQPSKRDLGAAEEPPDRI
jgi:hypothetical protein